MSMNHLREYEYVTRKNKFIKSNQYLDLSLHGDAEEGDEVHDEDRPEHRDVENLEKGTAESYHLKFAVSFKLKPLTKFIDVIMRATMVMIIKVQQKAIT